MSDASYPLMPQPSDRISVLPPLCFTTTHTCSPNTCQQTHNLPLTYYTPHTSSHPHTLTPSLGAEPAGPAVTGTFRSKRWPVDCPVAGCKGEKGARGDVGPSGPRVR